MSTSIVPSCPTEPGPLVFKLATMIEPNSFWATEIPYQHGNKSAGASDFSQSSLHQVLVYEEKLAGMYNAAEARINPEGQIADADLREDLLVAVRSDHESPFWFRGRILDLAYTQRGIFARLGRAQLNN